MRMRSRRPSQKLEGRVGVVRWGFDVGVQRFVFEGFGLGFGWRVFGGDVDGEGGLGEGEDEDVGGLDAFFLHAGGGDVDFVAGIPTEL